MVMVKILGWSKFQSKDNRFRSGQALGKEASEAFKDPIKIN